MRLDDLECDDARLFLCPVCGQRVGSLSVCEGGYACGSCVAQKRAVLYIFPLGWGPQGAVRIHVGQPQELIDLLGDPETPNSC